MPALSFQTAPGIVIHTQLSIPPNEAHSKPLIVLLHYWGGSSSTWHKLTTPNSPTSLTASHPTLAIDHRGWGRSTAVDENGDTYSIANMASDLNEILSQLRTESNHPDLLQHGFVLVGHSMGAKVALASLGLFCSDLLGLLKGLVLIAPAPPTALDLPAEMKAQQQVAYESEDTIRWTVANVLANAEKLTDADTALVVRDSLSGNVSAKRAWPSYGMQEDISEQVAKTLTSCPGLRATILVGELDIVEPKERVQEEVASYLARYGVEIALKVVSGVRHLVPLEDPTSVYEAICQF